MQKHALSLLITLVFVVSAGHVFAEEPKCPPKPEAVDQQRELAGTWFAQGQKYGREKQVVGALEAFLCSMTMVEHESTLNNIKKATTMVDDKEIVIDRLDTYLATAPEGGLSDQLAELNTTLKEQHAAENQVAPEDELPGHIIEEPSTINWKYPAFISFGVGGFTLISSIVYQSMAIVAKKNKEDAKRDEDAALEERSRSIYQSEAIAGFVITGVAVSAGIIMYLWAVKTQKKPEPAQTAKVRLAPTGNGLVLTGSF